MPNKTITQVPVAAKHVKRIIIQPDSIAGEVVTWKLSYSYDPVDDAGVSIRVVDKVRAGMPLTAGQQTALQNFVTGQIVPDANTTEGT